MSAGRSRARGPASESGWRGLSPSRSASSALLGKGLRSRSHQKSASCIKTASCVGLSPSRFCARNNNEGTMQKPSTITSLPHFFSEARPVSLPGNRMTFCEAVSSLFAHVRVPICPPTYIAIRSGDIKAVPPDNHDWSYR